MVNDLDNADINFPVSKKDYSRIEKKNNICINVFCYENDLVYPVHLSDEKFYKCMYLLLITDENKSHYVCIKDLTDLCAIRQKIRITSTFADTVYNVFVMKKS